MSRTGRTVIAATLIGVLAALVAPVAAHAVDVPTAAITSPTAGSVLTGPPTVLAHGDIPVALPSTAVAITLLVDGLDLASPESPTSCPGQPDDHRCDASIPWSIDGLSGRHTLQVRFDTSAGSVLSSVVTVYVRTGVAVSLTLPTVKTGHSVTGRGRVTSTASGAAIAGAKVTVRLVPASGAARTIVLTTNATGYVAWTYTPKYKTSVVATASPGLWWLGGRSSSFHAVTGISRCTWTHRVSHTRRATGECHLLRPPARATVKLQVFSQGYWVDLSGTKSMKKAKVPFWVKARVPITVKFRVVFVSCPLYSTTNSRAMRIRFT